MPRLRRGDRDVSHRAISRQLLRQHCTQHNSRWTPPHLHAHPMCWAWSRRSRRGSLYGQGGGWCVSRFLPAQHRISEPPKPEVGTLRAGVAAPAWLAHRRRFTRYSSTSAPAPTARSGSAPGSGTNRSLRMAMWPVCSRAVCCQWVRPGVTSWMVPIPESVAIVVSRATDDRAGVRSCSREGLDVDRHRSRSSMVCPCRSW